MKWLLIFVMFSLGLVLIGSIAGASAAAERSEKQGKLLVELERTGAPAASMLAAEWLDTYPNPSNQNLAELAVIVARAKADPVSVEGLTTEAKRRKQAAAAFEPAFGWRDPKPGL